MRNSRIPQDVLDVVLDYKERAFWRIYTLAARVVAYSVFITIPCIFFFTEKPT